MNLWWLRFNRGSRSWTGREAWRWSLKFLLRWRDRFYPGRWLRGGHRLGGRGR